MLKKVGGAEEGFGSWAVTSEGDSGAENAFLSMSTSAKKR